MIRPTPGELLRGVREALRESVLPALPPGQAQRQLKAALHALGRLERCWDRLPAGLAADNADLRGTAQSVIAALLPQAGADAQQLQRLAARCAEPAAAADPAVPGIGDPALARAAAENLALQQALTELDACVRGRPERPARAAQLDALAGLYRRMVARERAALATEDGDE